MKSVLISTRPKWVEKICHKIGEDETGKAIYEKRIEVRKTAPQEVPFKCYIYETQGRTETPWIDEDGHFIYKGRGQVIGEFICNNASELDYVYYWNNGYEFATCLTYRQVADYGKGKTLYGWHISDLKIYDRPRELSEFRKSGFMTEEEWLFNLYPNTHCHYEAWAKKFEITRPPQSWCYVEDLGEERMKNKEVYAKELTEFYLDGETFAVNKNNGRLVKCRDMACPNCVFDSDVPCSDKQKEWAEQEYEEPMLTE